jgi:predicted kinase
LKIIVTVGLPGSGKSTYLAGLGVNPISSDEIRRLIADDPEDQTIHKQVFATMRYLVRQRLAAGRPETYVDATNLTRWERHPYIQLARSRECEIEAIHFDVPLKVCIERNNKRQGRVVPEEAIRSMSQKLEPPSTAEGFTKIVTIANA